MFVKMKLLGITSVDSEVTDQQRIGYFNLSHAVENVGVQ
jgi:hypothetical protein